jgi:DNA-directed RNA polymerase I, II, and III subunit RPABC1
MNANTESFKQNTNEKLDDIRILYRVKRNQVKMLTKRGYKDAEEEFKKFLSEEPNEYYTEIISKGIREYDFSFFDKIYDNILIVIYYISPKRPAMKSLGSYVLKKAISMAGDEYLTYKIMIVVNKPVSHREISDLKDIDYRVFTLDELYYDPTEHYLNSQFYLMNENDSLEFLKRNNISFDDLPIISEEDPIAKYYDAKEGQIFRIERNNLLVETFSDGNVIFRGVRKI